MRHALILAALLAFTACGGGPSGGHAGRSQSPEEGRLRLARCMRENGVPRYPDDPRNLPEGGLTIPDRAMKACRKWAVPAGATPIDPNDPATRDRFLKLARCMRAHGVDWPDPSPGGLGGPPPDLSGVPDRAKVQAALKECQRS
jgi:hypothetical protein